jgi:hypothetical protein
LIITTASFVILPLNKLLADDPIKAKIIATAAIPKINANILGDTDSKLNTLSLLKKYITIQFFNYHFKYCPILAIGVAKNSPNTIFSKLSYDVNSASLLL